MLLPPLLRKIPLRSEQGPEGGAVDHYAVVEIGDVAGVNLAGCVLVFGGGRTFLGALLDGGDEGGELVAPFVDLGVAPLGGAGGLLVGSFAGGAEVGQLAYQARHRGV